VNVYIDGFNLYHAIRNLNEPYLKWLNLRSLAEKFIDRKHDVINEINYFSAIAKHLSQDIQLRHLAYISALKANRINFVEGCFKEKEVHFKNENGSQKIKKFEEKETDVNIVIHIVRDAISFNCDKMLVITNDTDITPALKMALKHNKNLKIKILTPPTYRLHYTLKSVIQQEKPIHILKEHIQRSLLPEEVMLPNGKIIRIPSNYKNHSISKNNN